MSALLEKKAAFTVNLLIEAACELLEHTDIHELSFKKVAEQADISQRTMFRYFKTRDDFLDALTARLYSDLALPDVPDNVEDLTDYIATLYKKLEAQPRKVMVLLSADLLPRIIKTSAKQRLAALEILLSKSYPDAKASDIKKTAANLRYVMSASSWRYYRMYFEFSPQMATECAQLLVKQAINHLTLQCKTVPISRGQ
ncbi:TetR/AcrR family transcriptional regulator [Alteromonas ponticola]|uniref:TetR/AcrR family transcriptional regulator n=1 Tax=Alteromonas aquimaris TaxID=2998417 RepID=A0ABT3P3M5_9ALTE|nr:helix-turn-helix domain-containing protein [Alteromonas aquimaris]MCW8107354.1 TetR/AcrR family transcriptional regulator [Alteromonas aquimaris]